MSRKYNEYKQLNLPKIGKEETAFWEENRIFEQSMVERKSSPPFVFYEGPPSANGVPGIHHVMGRAIKDIFCRYKSLKGYSVERKAGWDTHGLPVEIGVEKKLGITKEDIGKSISIEDYNKECRSEVMKYTDLWDKLTQEMGYWVDLKSPYITYKNTYIESVWWLLEQLYNKKLLYKGYTIQPYSPAAGTGLSTHELNQPGCYKQVKDNSLTAQFKLIRNEQSEFLFSKAHAEVYFLAWTTTPWTLPSNTALAVGKNIEYVLVDSFNPYTGLPVSLILAKELFSKYFPEKNAELSIAEYKEGDKNIPFRLLDSFKGIELNALRYEQLMPYVQPEDGDAFRVIIGDFVTTEDGTGIVHIAPSFGADDFRVAKQNGIGSLTLVNKQGAFIEGMGPFSGRYVKPEYDPQYNSQKAESVDVDIIVHLKKLNLAFKAEKYEHSYPHCWRTDKPILYYPLDSWFVKTTACKGRMIELNKSIHWKPEHTGSGRFGNWLENLVDWNLSRSRYWGIPLPIWTSESGDERICIGSVEKLKMEIEKSMAAGLMKSNPLEGYQSGIYTEENYLSFDLHRPYVDEIVLISSKGEKMYRESDLIDVWFDSGSMPYAQLHYPFENKEIFEKRFPADFIAEGVDQTRGWFFTLHAIATMVFDSVAFKNVVSNGLVLDKKGNKMSKRLGNGVDPFATIEKYGPDATRWYMISNAQPWDNLKFDEDGIAEVQRKFFGTLYNTYSFFALYANIDQFSYQEDEIDFAQRPELDRWVLSELNSLIRSVDEYYADYEPTKAARAIQSFVDQHLSNWYVRLSRRRFWKGEYSTDKISAYQTLYTCLANLAKLISPIAPFFAERLYKDLNSVSAKEKALSVHLTEFPSANPSFIDPDLESRMELSQRICSMVLSLRKRTNLKVRQPLNKIMIPALHPQMQEQISAMKELILSEVNIKEIEFITESDILSKKIKPNFKSLGPKYSTLMKQVAAWISSFDREQIEEMEKNGKMYTQINGQDVEILAQDVEIITDDIPGWVVASENGLSLALDIHLSQELIEEGLSRELINRIQNLRKELLFEVTDHIVVEIQTNSELDIAIKHNYDYICSETLSKTLSIKDKIDPDEKIEIELSDTIKTVIYIQKYS